MLLFEIIRVSFSALMANKGRAALTMLGIIIGVGAVITMSAVGAGAAQAVKARISALGANLLFVHPHAILKNGVRVDPAPLTTEDADTLQHDLPLDAEIVPEVGRNYQVQYRDMNTNTRITGTTGNYFSLRDFHFASGRPFNDAEITSRRRVAVVGSQAAEDLDGGPTMLGDDIRISGSLYEVIGVLKSKGAQGWHNPDDQVFIPISTAQYRLMGSDRLNDVTIHVDDPSQTQAVEEAIERTLRRQHHLGLDAEDDFEIHNQADIAATFEATSQTFSLLLTSIAAVSLMVGGIGIMNIMLVSVTERTKEIGIRKAIGARRTTILLQFLLESVILCVVGGGVGIAFGGWAAHVMASTGGWSVIVTPGSIALAVGFSVGIGLFFGIYPASRAAKLDPIEALRYE